MCDVPAAKPSLARRATKSPFHTRPVSSRLPSVLHGKRSRRNGLQYYTFNIKQVEGLNSSSSAQTVAVGPRECLTSAPCFCCKSPIGKRCNTCQQHVADIMYAAGHTYVYCELAVLRPQPTSTPRGVLEGGTSLALRPDDSGNLRSSLLPRTQPQDVPHAACFLAAFWPKPTLPNCT